MFSYKITERYWWCGSRGWNFPIKKDSRVQFKKKKFMKEKCCERNNAQDSSKYARICLACKIRSEREKRTIGEIEFPIKNCVWFQDYLPAGVHVNYKGCPHGVMVKAMDYRIIVCEFVLQSRYYVLFQANTLGKGMNPLILPAMG